MMEFKSCSGVFNRLDDEKKKMILSVSIKAFSENGFKSANINTIADNAGVSVGAMYKYFENKRALYLTCLEWSLMHLSSKISSVVDEEPDFLGIIEKIIRVIQEAKAESEPFNKLYYEMATESNAEFAMLIASQIEGVTSNLYAAYLEEAQKNNLIRQDIDPRFFAFFIDNLFIMLQFSYSCEYYKDRMQLYTYDDVFLDDARVREQAMRFIKGALFYSEEE
ncbi:MAG: TetR/AcrR family transcriptional regulator [Eubacteriales bacterium]